MPAPLKAIYTGDDLIELDPPRATLEQAQLALTNRHELVRVESDVWDVVRHLQRIDRGLQMFFDKRQGIFVLFWKGVREKDGRAELVEDVIGAYRELDQRIVKLIERIDAQGRGKADLQRDLERLEAEKDREQNWQQAQTVGNAAEHLRHAIRRDLALEQSTVHLSGSRGGQKMRREQRRQQKMGRRSNRQGSR